MDLIKSIIIPNPPSKMEWLSKKKLDKKGNLAKVTHYLTANLFYADQVDFYTRTKIVNFAKDFLKPHLKDLPKILKCRITVTYCRPDDNFDLDNKVYFWVKIMLDILKTPSNKQHFNAFMKDRAIKTVECLPDDTVRHCDEIIMRYQHGSHAIKIEIRGILKAEQSSLFP